MEGGDPKGRTAHNTRTGANYARVPCRQPAPRTAAAPPPVRTLPQVGMVIEPKISIGGGGTSSDPTYRSTGAQAPFDGNASRNNVQVCGGATFWPVSGAGAVKIGVDVQTCSGPSAFGGGDDTLFRIPRHGPGDVDLRARTNVIFDVFAKVEMPVAPNWFFSAGVGPTFRQIDLTLSSNQSFFGGGIPTTSNSGWQTGVGVAAGTPRSCAQTAWLVIR